MVKYHKWQTKEWNERKKETRDYMAKSYRTIRKDNPAIARLLFKRQKWCEKEFNRVINAQS